jgi:hypothetical protein
MPDTVIVYGVLAVPAFASITTTWNVAPAATLKLNGWNVAP